MMFSQLRLDGLRNTVHAALVMHSAGITHETSHVPRSRYPRLVEQEFGDALVAITRRITAVYEPLRTLIPRMVEMHYGDLERSMAVHRDAPADTLAARNVLEQLREQSRAVLNAGEMDRLSTFYGTRVSNAQRAELGAQLRAGLGVDIPVNDRNTPDLLAYFTRENAARISTIPERFHAEIADLTAQAYRKRMNVETFGRLLSERFHVAESWARFIARDQLGKLNGQLSAVRHQSLGIVAYFWRTRLDAHVRPEHRRREGVRFIYDAEPPNGGLPGEDYGCRCVAQPDLSGIVAAIRDARRFPGQFSAPLAGTLSRR